MSYRHHQKRTYLARNGPRALPPRGGPLPFFLGSTDMARICAALAAWVALGDTGLQIASDESGEVFVLTGAAGMLDTLTALQRQLAAHGVPVPPEASAAFRRQLTERAAVRATRPGEQQP